MVLLILGGIWAVFLVPPYLRNRAESRPADSIGDFRHQLRVLERTAPTGIPAANRARPGATPMARMVAQRPAPGGPAPRGAAGLRSVPTGAAGTARDRGGLGRAAAVTAARRRQAAQRRRRDIFCSLAVASTGSLLLGFLPGLSALWYLTAALTVVLGAYVALLVRMRNEAAEREMKLRFLPGGATPQPALLLRRSAN